MLDGKTDKIISNITSPIFPISSISPVIGEFKDRNDTIYSAIYAMDYDDSFNVLLVENDDINLENKTKIAKVVSSIGSGAYFPSELVINENIAFIPSEDGRVIIIDIHANKKIATILSGNALGAIALNPETNMVYVADGENDTVSVIDALHYRLITTKQVGTTPADITVNPETNMVYVVNSDSNTVSVIDGSTNEVMEGAIFNVNPVDSGQVVCGKQIPTNLYVKIKAGTSCKANANSGFVFNSWTEKLGSNSSRTITKSPTNSIFSNPNDDKYANFTVTSFGNYIANFREAPSPIPEGVWISLFGIMLGTIMPSIIRWLNGLKQRKRFYRYMEDSLPGMTAM
jgi:YVTN family beta-propeller protein